MPEPISKLDPSRSRTMTVRLVDSLTSGRDRIVLGRFPGVPRRSIRSGRWSVTGRVLDLQLESDGRVRSTGPLARLPDGRIALGFAALGAGWSVRQASSAQRVLIAPNAPLNDTPTYSLGTLLACLASKEGAARFGNTSKGGSSSWAPRCSERTSTAGRHATWGERGTLHRATAARPKRACSNARRSRMGRGRCSKSQRSSRRQAIGR